MDREGPPEEGALGTQDTEEAISQEEDTRGVPTGKEEVKTGDRILYGENCKDSSKQQLELIHDNISERYVIFLGKISFGKDKES